MTMSGKSWRPAGRPLFQPGAGPAESPAKRSPGGRGDNRTDIRFEDIGTHAGYVPYVIPHVVSNNGRVARVVFGNAGFNFTDQIGPTSAVLVKIPLPTRAKAL